MNDKYDLINDLKLVQSASGVKASIDSLLLARYLKPSPEWRVADLGCGNGMIGLLLAMENPLCRFLGIEIQQELITQARESARINGLDNIQFLRADLRTPPWADTPEHFDMVLANPPYRKVGTGRVSPDPARAAARHEIFGNAHDFAHSASSMLRDGGSSIWIYLAERIDDLTDALNMTSMKPVRYRFVLSREGEEPSLVLLEALKGGSKRAVCEERPLVLYGEGKGRDYTEEAWKIIYG